MIKSKVGFIGISDHAKKAIKVNTGNYLHGHAARSVTANHMELGSLLNAEVRSGIKAIIPSGVTHIGFVAATTIPVNKRPSFTELHPKMAKFIENSKLPVMLFGLGAQSSLDASIEESEINSDTLQLLNVFSHHCETIGVRGAYTADLLAKYGINNVEVVGCQSCFLSCRPDFKFPSIDENSDLGRVLVNFTRLHTERPLLDQAIKMNASVIGQSSHFERWLKDKSTGLSLSEVPEDNLAAVHPKTIEMFSNGDVDFQVYHRWIRTHFQQFYNMPEWFDFIRGNFDVAIGTRFHGNMAAMLSGVPALWVVHDSRTQEFCNHLGLPQVPLSEVQKGRSVKDLVSEYLKPDQFNKVYPENYARFYNYIERQGVEHRLAPPV